jgi:hypothetical protein
MRSVARRRRELRKVPERTICREHRPIVQTTETGSPMNERFRELAETAG